MTRRGDERRSRPSRAVCLPGLVAALALACSSTPEAPESNVQWTEVFSIETVTAYPGRGQEPAWVETREELDSVIAEAVAFKAADGRPFDLTPIGQEGPWLVVDGSTNPCIPQVVSVVQEPDRVTVHMRINGDFGCPLVELTGLRVLEFDDTIDAELPATVETR